MSITACNERGNSPPNSQYTAYVYTHKGPATINYTDGGRPSASPWIRHCIAALSASIHHVPHSRWFTEWQNHNRHHHHHYWNYYYYHVSQKVSHRFLPRDAMPGLCSRPVSVCLSPVCPTRSCIVSTWLKIWSDVFLGSLATSF